MTESSVDPLTGVTLDAVIFDLAGTLTDSPMAVVRAYEPWAAELGIDPGLLPHLLGMPSDATAEVLAPLEQVAVAVTHIEELEVGGH